MKGMFFMKPINRVKELRLAKKLNQVELARELNISQPSLSAWENNKNEIDHENLYKLSTFFNVSIDYILGVSDEPNPPQKNMPTHQELIYPAEIIRLAERIQNLPSDAKDLIFRQIRLFEAMDKK